MPRSARASHKRELTHAIAVLRARQLRITEPRRLILGALIADHGPFSMEEIHRLVKKSGCDLVTVYRSMPVLEEAGLVRRCDFGKGVVRYEFNHGDHHHHHIICRKCQKVETVDLCVADALERLVKQRGYTEVTHQMELFGICPDCQRRC
ncbi:MAG TPA: Fur family transcriptional regulator [Verrucomicrobiae bacterium]|nr:Fur family transcriptional regulator [Verrucomicrobiae bacterium]